MASEDFIQLDPEETNKNDICHHLESMISESNVQHVQSPDKLGGSCRSKEADVLSVHGNDEVKMEIKDPEPENLTMNGYELLKIEVSKTDKLVDKTDDIQPSNGSENGFPLAVQAKRNDQKSDESPIAGIKRARMEIVDHQFGDQPSVHVTYNSLTRESKTKLKELLEQWSQWHAQHETSDKDPSKILEHGEETYFPALNVGGESSFTVTFWVDNLATKDENKEVVSVNSESAPLYDRGYVLGTTVDGGSSNGRGEGLLASRCFNCGSYSHSLKECSRPRDMVAINNARKQRSAMKSTNSGAKGPSRYYLSSSGKFDDLKPGALSAETRACLGIGEFDPPPWLQRMREIGYPPGYLDVKEDENQPSGITIYGAEDAKPEYEDGELPERGEPILERTMTVEFPGINAPIPENADERRWTSTPASSTEQRRNRYENSPSLHLSDSQRGFPQDQSRHREYVSHHGLDMGPSPSHGYSQRYSPYSQSPTARSPVLGRSLSDRWGSPLAREGPGYGPPSPLYSGSHSQSSHSLSSHHSPGFDRWDPSSPYGSNHGGSSSYGRDRERYDPQRHHHHHLHQRR